MPFQSTPVKRQCLASPTANSSEDSSTRLYNFTIWRRFCVAPNCGVALDDGLLSRKDKCPKCQSSRPNQSDCRGIWNRCETCQAFNKCTYAFCEMCGRKNSDYDPDKPRRLDDAYLKKQHAMWKKDSQEELNSVREQNEALKAENFALRQQLEDAGRELCVRVEEDLKSDNALDGSKTSAKDDQNAMKEICEQQKNTEDSEFGNDDDGDQDVLKVYEAFVLTQNQSTEGESEKKNTSQNESSQDEKD